MQDRPLLRGVGIGAGYFSHFHYDAWRRIPDVAITAIGEQNRPKAEAVMQQFGIPRYFADLHTMLEQEQPDFVDIITPPPSHYELCHTAAQAGVTIICQKPLAPTYAESAALIEMVEAAGVRFMVHENWRWQPWYREIKRLLEQDVLGKVFSIYFRMRMGDGWGEDAYLARQPYFRDYPRLLIYETGVHFIDAFRYLLGEITTVYARLRRLNPVIRGEDSGQVVLSFAGGATAILDGNRYNESDARNPRLTFGEMRIDGSKGHLLLTSEGEIAIKPLGAPTYLHPYPYADRGFAGDSVYHLQRHFVACLQSGAAFESSGQDYLRTLKVVEAVYASAATGQAIDLATWQPDR